MQFKIVNITQERRMNGTAIIEAVSIEENPVALSIEITGNSLSDEHTIRAMLNVTYNEIKCPNTYVCKIGDII